MQISGGPHPPAGWYPNPAGIGARWWDGYAWTAYTAAGPPPAGGGGAADWAEGTGGGGRSEAVPGAGRPPGTGTADVGGRWRWDPAAGWRWMPAWAGEHDWPRRLHPLVDAEHRMGSVARWAIVAMGLAAIGGSAHFLGYESVARSYVHWIRLAWDADRANVAAPLPPAVPASYVVTTYLADLIELAMAVLFLSWQHRAAVTARWLGLPGRHSPGWGVAFWFIPVANLWCPYQALRDCLPPGHAARRLVLGCWLLYLATVLVSIAVFVAAAFSPPAGIALIVVLAALWLSVLVLGRRLIATVGTAHRAIVGA